MIKKLTLVASLALLVAACGDRAGNNQTGDVGNEGAGENTASAMPSGPFAQIEMDMHQRMTAAAGSNTSETWARKMIEHHRGAVQMSQRLIDQGRDPQMVEMARKTAEKQQREIGELERLLSAGIKGGSGEPNPFGSIEQQMHQAMMAASGANLSETWARKMIVHHQGAVDMSEALIRQGGDAQVLALARRAAENQRREITHLEAMLRGEGMPAQAPTPSPEKKGSSTPATPAGKEGEATPKTIPKSAQPGQTSAKTAPKPETSTTSPSTCTPEHEAMGHCKQ